MLYVLHGESETHGTTGKTDQEYLTAVTERNPWAFRFARGRPAPPEHETLCVPSSADQGPHVRSITPRGPRGMRIPMRPLRYEVLGIPVDAVDLASTVERIERWIASDERHYVCHLTVHGVMEARHDPALGRIYEA